MGWRTESWNHSNNLSIWVTQIAITPNIRLIMETDHFEIDLLDTNILSATSGGHHTARGVMPCGTQHVHTSLNTCGSPS